jgi:hypothetical protein
VLARGTKVWMDDFGGSIGTTQILTKIRSGSITINNNLEEKVFSENVVDPHTDFARGPQIITGELVMEHNDDTVFGKMRSRTQQAIQIAQTGPNIGATPTTDYLWQIQIPQATLLAPSMGYAGQNKIITFPYVADRNTSVPGGITVKDVISAATVAA